MNTTINFTCQSCGMPMVATEHFGTNKDLSKSQDYCSYCFREGDFTADLTLEEMIQSSMQYPESVPPEHALKSQPEQALNYRLYLLELKRWKNREKTQNAYFKAISRVISYIREHLSETLELKTLADIAHISRFHFIRVFKAVINETPGEYIQRLRLEKVAFRLQTSRLTLAQIAEETGYQTQHSLSKSFKKYFRVSPSAYRKNPADLTTPIRYEECAIVIEPTIRKVPEKEILCSRVLNAHTDEKAYLKSWEKLLEFLPANGIPDSQTAYYCVSLDAPTITQPERQHIYVGIETKFQKKPSGIFEIRKLTGRMYAVFCLKGPYEQLPDVYCYIYRYWLPNSEYEAADCVMFEKFLNNSRFVKEEEILTEIYIPVVKKN